MRIFIIFSIVLSSVLLFYIRRERNELRTEVNRLTLVQKQDSAEITSLYRILEQLGPIDSVSKHTFREAYDLDMYGNPIVRDTAGLYKIRRDYMQDRDKIQQLHGYYYGIDSMLLN